MARNVFPQNWFCLWKESRKFSQAARKEVVTMEEFFVIKFLVIAVLLLGVITHYAKKVA